MNTDKNNSVSPNTDATPNSLNSPDGLWIVQSLNHVGTKLDKLEDRLRRLETKIYFAIGFVACLGVVIGLVAKFVSFDFEIAIVPKSD